LCPTKANQGFLFVSAKPNRPALAVAFKVYSPSKLAIFLQQEFLKDSVLDSSF
jgi:hypothetical protein